MTFVDVGANIGLFTLMAARATGPSGHVYSFEPDAGNAALLKKNVEQNGYGNVTLIQKAVSDMSGHCTLYQSGFNTGDHRTYHVSRGRRQVTIECISLDAYFSPDTRIDMIKMDIEGAEETALRGIERLLASHREIQLIIECWPSMLQKAGSDPLAIFQSLEDQGFTLSVIDDAADAIFPLLASAAVQMCWEKSVANILCVRGS